MGESCCQSAGAQVTAGEVQLCQRPLPKQTLEIVLHGRAGDEVDVEVETGDVEGGVHGAEVEGQLVVHAGAGAHAVRRDVVVPLLQQHLEESELESWSTQQPLQDPRLETHGVELELLVLVCAVGEGELREHGQSTVVELDPTQDQPLLPRAVSAQERRNDLGHHHLVAEQHPLQDEAGEVWGLEQLGEHEEGVLGLAGHDFLLRESIDGESQGLKPGDLVVRGVHDNTVDAREEEIQCRRVLKLDPQFLQRAESRGEHPLDEVVAIGHLVLVELALHNEAEVADVLEDGCHLLDAAVLPQSGAEEVPCLQLEGPRAVVARLEQNCRHAGIHGRVGGPAR